ncbi:MAG: hypothetical protein CMM02_19825 [Rhodopirellula sp.]|nr:hypothetical protein [Rhodopirellula sp.]|tara:strand:+ start:1255 stop:1443 length:189 start_codon:yes stop_codon:yes gene_type:complete
MPKGELNDARDEIFNYLHELRESGTINMFGAPQVIQDVFGLPKNVAREIFIEWTQTFTTNQT